MVRYRYWGGLFAVATASSTVNSKRIPWLGLIAFGLLVIAATGLANLPDVQRQSLLQSLQSLLVWLPVLYGVVVLSYAGRYWRWRLLLGRLGIGRINWSDLLGWFKGFALTATPAKVGELSRVELLHEQLGYPRLQLVHVFIAERFADAAAVGLLLFLLIPKQLLSWIPSAGPPWFLAIGLVTAAASLFISRPCIQRWLPNSLHRWRDHLPNGSLARSFLPAIPISVLVWANEALVLWMLVQLLAPTRITIPAAITIYLLSGTAGMASSLPGGIGVNEAATVLLLGQQGVPAAIALPIAVLRRLITLWSMVALAAGISVLPFPAGNPERRNYLP